MTDQTKSSPRPSLFARKGEAEPTAAVAHMSLEQLQDQPPCRSQWDECQGDGGFTDRRVRRVPDRNDQQISPPRSGLAVGRRHTPCAVAKEKPAVREETVKIWQPKTMISPLSSLIVRQRDIVTRPVSWGSEQAPCHGGAPEQIQWQNRLGNLSQRMRPQSARCDRRQISNRENCANRPRSG